jgi:hypothetical protein
MTTIAYPNTNIFLPESILWRLEDSVSITTSALNGHTKTKELPGARWVVTLSYGEQTAAERAEVEGWWAKSGQRKHDITLWHHSRPQPRGTIAGLSPSVLGATAQGVDAISFACGAGTAGRTMKTGDLFGVGGRIRMVTADAVVDGSNNIGVFFEPTLEAAVSNGAAVTLLRPTSKFISVSGGVAVPYRGSFGGPGFSIDLVEVF